MRRHSPTRSLDRAERRQRRGPRQAGQPHRDCDSGPGRAQRDRHRPGEDADARDPLSPRAPDPRLRSGGVLRCGGDGADARRDVLDLSRPEGGHRRARDAPGTQPDRVQKHVTLIRALAPGNPHKGADLPAPTVPVRGTRLSASPMSTAPQQSRVDKSAAKPIFSDSALSGGKLLTAVSECHPLEGTA